MFNFTIDPNRKLHTWEALTNVAYLFAAAIILTITPGITAIIPAIALVWLAIGSYLCHLNIKENLCHLDWSGMFGVFGALIAYGLGIHNLLPFYSQSAEIAAQLFIFFASAVTPLVIRFDEMQQLYSYATIGVLWIASTALLFTIPAVIMFALAFLIRQLGAMKYDTNRDEELFHAGWHVLSAIGFVLMFF